MQSRKIDFLAKEHAKLLETHELLQEKVREAEEIESSIPSQLDDQLIESQLLFVRTSHFYSSLELVQDPLFKEKLENLLKFGLKEGPFYTEYLCLRKMYEKLLVRVRDFRGKEGGKDEKGGDGLSFSGVLAQSREKMKVSEILEERKPRLLHRKHSLNKSFELDKSSCNKYKCWKGEKTEKGERGEDGKKKTHKSYLSVYLNKKEKSEKN